MMHSKLKEPTFKGQNLIFQSSISSINRPVLMQAPASESFLGCFA